MATDSMTDLIDQPSKVREEELFELPPLQSYLEQNLEKFSGQLTVRQFRRGHSNLTYLISDGVSQWVLRRPPFGSKVATAHDMSREYLVLSGLWRAYPHVPRALLYCDDLEIIGAPFYVMERLTGLILRKDPPRRLALEPKLARRLAMSFIDNLVEIHSVDLEKAGLSGFGKPDGFTRRQVEGWTERYFKSQTDDIPSVEKAADWLAERIPSDSQHALIHNDYKYDNLVLDPADPSRIIGVLDWEMATVGNPLMDLGTSLTYWIERDDPPMLQALRFGPTNIAGTPTKKELINRYAERTGTEISNIDFYHVFGLFKTAVVAQQIYYRFKVGKTRDSRFESFIMGVKILADEAWRISSNSTL